MTISALNNSKFPKPRAVPGFVIDRETLEHLPALHRCAAEIAIAAGKWRLV